MGEFSHGEIAAFISQVGFPILVACWLLYRYEKRLERISTVLTAMAERLKVSSLGRDDQS